MTTRVIEFIRSNGLLSPGDRVLCAVSGGADSMAMLHMLLLLREKLHIDVCCGHYDHGIRGAESRRDARFVEEICEKLDVPFVSEKGDVPAYAKKTGMGTEEAARELRYAFLEKAAVRLGCNKIATAHNAMDNAETMLMNLLRGAGLRGLGGIAPQRGNVIRPILCLDRPEIEAYLKENHIEFVTDSTNLSDDYTRNRLRHRIMEPLRETEPGFAGKFLSTALSLREDEEYLHSLALQFVEDSGHISCAALSQLPPPVASRAVMILAPQARNVHVRAVLELARGGEIHGEVHLPGMRVLRQYDQLVFGAECPDSPEDALITPGERVNWGEYTVTCCKGGGEGNKRSFSFKTGEICGNISVGSRREGDKIRLRGRNCSKTLKKLFSEARIPPNERGLIPVIRDEKGILAVYGFGCAQREGDAGDTIQINIEKRGTDHEK